jgi:hypothetical protein
MKQGASPALCKAFMDALDAAAAHTTRYREECRSTQVDSDLEEEGYLYWRYRREFVELLGPPFPATPPLPPSDSELWAARLRRAPANGAGQPPSR